MDGAGIARSVLSIAGPGVQSRARRRDSARRAREANDFLAREISQTARPLFRLRASCHAGPACGGRRAGALHARAQILRRHDQRPHQRPISRSSLAAIRSGSGPRSCWRTIYIHPDRSGRRPSPALDGYDGLAPRDLGVGLRNRLARAAAGLQRPVRPLPAGAGHARPSRRDVAVPAVALRQPRQALRREARPKAVRLHQAEYRGDDVGHVLGGAAQLRDRRARRGPRDVRRRLSVRAGGGGRQVHGRDPARRGHPQGYRVQ